MDGGGIVRHCIRSCSGTSGFLGVSNTLTVNEEVHISDDSYEKIKRLAGPSYFFVSGVHSAKYTTPNDIILV